MLHIGEKLRRARLEHNLSLRELAEKAEVSASLLSQIENGKANPSVRSLYSIAAALSLPTNYFFPDSDGNGSEIKDDVGDISQLTANAIRTRQSEGLIEDSDLFPTPPQPPKGPVVYHHNRVVIELMGGVTWERLTPGSEDNIEFMQVCYAVGATSGAKMSHHTGREFGLILEGELTIELGFEQYVLHGGDSIAFNSTMPHRMSNTGSVPVHAIWVVLDRG
jgi:transcriptional regulator with XRE-family HTH domain